MLNLRHRTKSSSMFFNQFQGGGARMPMDKAAGRTHKKEALQGSRWSQETVALREAADVGWYRAPPNPLSPCAAPRDPAGSSRSLGPALRAVPGAELGSHTCYGLRVSSAGNYVAIEAQERWCMWPNTPGNVKKKTPNNPTQWVQSTRRAPQSCAGPRSRANKHCDLHKAQRPTDLYSFLKHSQATPWQKKRTLLISLPFYLRKHTGLSQLPGQAPLKGNMRALDSAHTDIG